LIAALGQGFAAALSGAFCRNADLDGPYRTHGSGIDGPGRSLWTGLRWGW